MPCYLCAYQSTRQPSLPKPLPQGSPASPAAPLGTCDQCSVWACSGHSSYFATFLCAMCRSAAAIAATVTPSAPGATSPSSRAAAEIARLVGEETGEHRQDVVQQALVRIVSDARRAVAPPSRRLDTEAEGLPPNLVADFEREVIELGGPADAVPAVREGRRALAFEGAEHEVRVPLAGIGGAIRGLFTPEYVVDVTHADGIVVTGALVLAVNEAHNPGEPVDPKTIEIPPPWEMTHPILLPPAAWLVATAIQRP